MTNERDANTALAANLPREWLEYEMWFEQPIGLQFKVTCRIKGYSEELMSIARANWDFNVSRGCRAVSARP